MESDFSMKRFARSLLPLGLLLLGWGSPLAQGQESFTPQVTLAQDPSTSRPLRYIPAQTQAAFPERLNQHLRRITTGIIGLEPDRQRPIAGGFEYLPGASGSYIIHHRRGGARCSSDLSFEVRMDVFQAIAAFRLGVRDEGRLVWLGEFPQRSFQVYPGRVAYALEHPELRLKARVEVVSPAAVPAYGLIARVELTDLSGAPRKLELVAAGQPGAGAPSALQGQPLAQDYLKLDCPQKKGDMHFGVHHDPDYDVLAGWDGRAQEAAAQGNAATRRLALAAGGEARAQLTVFVDSPGYDETSVTQRMSAFFNRNQQIPPATRERMTQEALDTFARIVVAGDRRFAQTRNDGGQAFAACLEAWGKGLYRQQPVRFELSDKKLESLANLVAQDLFPGLAQPPGLVHDSKTLDIWNYIFAYRHVHAASDIALEHRALDYLNLLSNNVQPSGAINSITADFKKDAHPTRFEESYIEALWHYYKWTGDLTAVERLWPTVTGAAAWMDKNLDPNGDNLYKDVLHQWKSDFDSRGPSSSFQTALVWRAYRDLAELAGKLGKPEEAKQYGAKAEAIHRAAMTQLWSNEFAMLGPKCPLGVLRLHPQCLEVDIPIWTRLTDPYQSVLLADWYLKNASFRDQQGGLYFYDNDWWSVVWSTHIPAEGDMMMSGWGLMLTGRHDEGARVLETAAAISCRGASPGFSYMFNNVGSLIGDGHDPATCQGAFVRGLVEGVFGVTPHVDEGYVSVHPRFPSTWDHARFTRPGLEVAWQRQGRVQTFSVKTSDTVAVALEIPVNAPVKKVLLNGKAASYTVEPSMRWALVKLRTPAGGGRVTLETEPKAWAIEAPAELRPGQAATIRAKGLKECRAEDPYGFFKLAGDAAKGGLKAMLKRAGSGQAPLFFNCAAGNIRWIEPLTLPTMAAQARDVTRRTVSEPLPKGTRLVMLDLAQAYNDDIQTCLEHPFRMDQNEPGQAGGMIQFWSMPLFKLTETLPRQVTVGQVPFKLGAMGPGEAEKEKDLIMLLNTDPYPLHTAARIELGGRRLHKIFLLALNMNMPMKTYVPAAVVTVKYQDGSQAETELTPPLNFDSYYQDFAINTVAYPFKAKPAYWQPQWDNIFGVIDQSQTHLTMTDIVCDPAKAAASVEIRSVMSETFMGVAGVTLAEAAAPKP